MCAGVWRGVGGLFGCPWALPRATLTMAVGPLGDDVCAGVCVWCLWVVAFPLGVAQGYVDHGRWPNLVLVGG